MSQKRVFNTNAEHIYVNDVPEYSLDLVNARSIDPAYSFTRNSSATYIGPDGLIKTAAVNQPRFEYDLVTGEYKGLLIEESRINLINVGNTPVMRENYAKISRTISNNILNPFGYYSNVAVFTRTSSSFLGPETIGPSGNITLVAGQAYTFSVFYKTLVGNFLGTFSDTLFLAQAFSPFTEFSGNLATSNSIAYPNGWTRYYRTLTATSTQSGYVTAIRVGALGTINDTTKVGISAAFWGLQIEAGSSLTSYIPTSGSAVTRQPDQLVLNKTLNTQGTFFIESNPTPTRGISLVADNGSSSLSISQPTNQYTKSVLYYNTNRTLRMSSDNSVPSDFSSFNLQNLNRVSLGFDRFNNSGYINGYLKKFSYYSSPLSEDNLRALTGNNVSASRYGSATNIVTNGLVLNLDASNPLSYPGSGTTWTDLSGNGNNGTLLNGVGYNSNNGGSLVFDGVNDYVSCGNPSSLNFGTGNFTLSFVTYTTAYGFQGGSYVGKGNGTTIGFDFRDYSFFVHGTLGLIAQGSFAATLNVWEIHTIVYDSSSSPYVKFYRNGTYTGASTSNIPANISSITTSEPFRIGLSVAGGPSRYFNGIIPSVQAYNRALSESEVQQNFNALRGRFGI